MGNSTSTVQDLSPIPSDLERNGLSLLGLKLSYLVFMVDQFSEDEEVKENLKNYTTAEICSLYVKPLTEGYRCSFCEYQQCLDDSIVGNAEVFISHAWKYKFLDVIKLLQRFFQHEPDIIIWFDIFSHNQHKSSDDRQFDWWSTTFMNAIEEIGRTVMVFTDWDNPIPLSRGWCIWELYCSITKKCSFDLAMSRSGLRLTEEVEDTPLVVMQRMREIIDCRKSECYLLTDQQQIHSTIEQTVGFEKLDELIVSTMTDWIIDKYEKEKSVREGHFGQAQRDLNHALQTNPLATYFDYNLAVEETNKGMYELYKKWRYAGMTETNLTINGRNINPTSINLDPQPSSFLTPTTQFPPLKSFYTDLCDKVQDATSQPSWMNGLLEEMDLQTGDDDEQLDD